MKINRPFSSNPFKSKDQKKSLRIRLNSAINDLDRNRRFNTINNRFRPKTSFQKGKLNLFSKNEEQKLDVLNLIIETNPNQYNSKKIKKKFRAINPLFLRGTEENLKRPNFSINTEEVFYKYNLLYGNNTNNLIRTYSPKMRPMSASINGYNKKMTQNLSENIPVFEHDEIINLVKARCKDIGIDVRENMIYKFEDYTKAKCKNRCVDLSECFLGINSTIIISNILYTSDRIARLNLTRNNLGDNGVKLLINSIKDSHSLVSLNITSNSITHKGGEVIFSQLINQQSIIDLNVSSIEGTNRNRLTADGIRHIEEFLKKNYFVESLNICGNSIKDEGFITLAKGLNNNQSLVKLIISNNDIHPKGLEIGLDEITSNKLYYLNISNNPILDVGIKKLTDSIKNFNNLHKLNVSNCSFEFPGFEHLINALQFIKRIEYLNISGNNIKSDNFENLKPCFSSFGIKYLNMSKCSLGNESTLILGECLQTNETIKTINISNNKITDKGFRSFIPLFKTNNTIENFDCSVNYITDITAKNFINNLKFNRGLKRINFFDNQLKNEMGNLFIEILETNKNLISINLVYNKIQMKIMEEINRILKVNNEKHKAKFIPNLQRDIKNLQFNPDLFSFYTQNINSKRNQQGDLYKRVKSDYKQFTKMLNIENRKIEKKVQELKTIQSKIVEHQKNIRDKKEKYEEHQKEIRDIVDEIEIKIEKEEKALKQIKSKNDFLQAEFNTNKKDLDQVIVDTQAKLKISLDKLNLAEKSFKHFTNQIKKKTELLKNMNNPEMLVNIKTKTEKKTKRQGKNSVIKLDLNQNNQNMTTIASTITNTNSNNDNLLTLNTISSSEVKKDKEGAKKNILKREKKKNKK